MLEAAQAIRAIDDKRTYAASLFVKGAQFRTERMRSLPHVQPRFGAAVLPINYSLSDSDSAVKSSSFFSQSHGFAFLQSPHCAPNVRSQLSRYAWLFASPWLNLRSSKVRLRMLV